MSSSNSPCPGINLRLTSHTTAVTSTSAGGMHRAESTPSRPSTLIHPNLKLAPIAPMYATTVLQTRMLTMRYRQRVYQPTFSHAIGRRLAATTGDVSTSQSNLDVARPKNPPRDAPTREWHQRGPPQESTITPNNGAPNVTHTVVSRKLMTKLQHKKHNVQSE